MIWVEEILAWNKFLVRACEQTSSFKWEGGERGRKANQKQPGWVPNRGLRQCDVGEYTQIFLHSSEI